MSDVKVLLEFEYDNASGFHVRQRIIEWNGDLRAEFLDDLGEWKWAGVSGPSVLAVYSEMASRLAAAERELAEARGWKSNADDLPDMRDEVFFIYKGDTYWCEYDGGWSTPEDYLDGGEPGILWRPFWPAPPVAATQEESR